MRYHVPARRFVEDIACFWGIEMKENGAPEVELSIIAPMYNEEAIIRDSIARMLSVLEQLAIEKQCGENENVLGPLLWPQRLQQGFYHTDS